VVALVIQCGRSKVAEAEQRPVQIRSLYTGPFWSTYRAALRRGGGHGLQTYVLSAEYGLLPETAMCAAYDRVLVDDQYRGQHKDGTPVRRIGDLVATVRDQAEAFGVSEVWFVGGQVYRRLLERAGLVVFDLEPGGLLAKRKALRRFVEDPRLGVLIGRARQRGSASRYPWLPLSLVLAAEPHMRRQGVSKVARSTRGFVRAYECAGGDQTAMGDVPASTPGRSGYPWVKRRDEFLARHLAQPGAMFESDGSPTRKHLALIAWAFSPDPARLRTWLSSR